MRTTVIGALCGALLALLAGGMLPSNSAVFAERPATGHDEGLIAFTSQSGESKQQLVVIDPRTRVVSVYHIEASNGEVSLKSVRNITWDLQMTEFNGVRPLPHEIRSMATPNRGDY